MTDLLNPAAESRIVVPEHRLVDESNANLFRTTLEDPSIKAFDIPAYKGSKGRTDRLGFLAPNDVFVGRIHFIEDTGYIFCHSQFKLQGDNEVITRMAPCCERELPRKRIAALVIQYGTNKEGELTRPLRYDLKVWRFSEGVFSHLRSANSEHPLAAHDVKVTCDDEQYQKYTIVPCKELVWRVPDFLAAFGKDIEEFVRGMLPRLPSAVGRKLTAQELLDKLGAAGSVPAARAPVDAAVEIADLLK